MVVSSARQNGDGSSTIKVQRLMANGRPDASFGLGGLATVPLPGLNVNSPSIAVAPDGDVLVAVYTFTGTGTAEQSTVSTLRFEGDGQLDRGFGSNGIATYTGPPTALGARLAVQRSGHVVLDLDLYSRAQRCCVWPPTARSIAASAAPETGWRLLANPPENLSAVGIGPTIASGSRRTRRTRRSAWSGAWTPTAATPPPAGDCRAETPTRPTSPRSSTLAAARCWPTASWASGTERRCFR